MLLLLWGFRSGPEKHCPQFLFGLTAFASPLNCLPPAHTVVQRLSFSRLFVNATHHEITFKSDSDLAAYDACLHDGWGLRFVFTSSFLWIQPLPTNNIHPSIFPTFWARTETMLPKHGYATRQCENHRSSWKSVTVCPRSWSPSADVFRCILSTRFLFWIQWCWCEGKSATRYS